MADPRRKSGFKPVDNVPDLSTACGYRLAILKKSRHNATLVRRIYVVGTSGSGKSTLTRQLAATIGVPHVELDSFG